MRRGRGKAKCHLFFFLVVLLLLSTPFSLSLNQETISLLTFKSAITQDPSSSLSNWNSSDPNPCSWTGITCNKNSTVISITLPKSNLYGSLPPLFSDLPSLRHIKLRNNRLHGSLPSTLTSSISLQSLVLYGNTLSGSLPFDIGNLTYHQILDISQNFFNGSLPQFNYPMQEAEDSGFEQKQLYWFSARWVWNWFGSVGKA